MEKNKKKKKKETLRKQKGLPMKSEDLKKETLRKQKGLPMKSEDLKYLRHFLSDLAEMFRVVLK